MGQAPSPGGPLAVPGRRFRPAGIRAGLVTWCPGATGSTPATS